MEQSARNCVHLEECGKDLWNLALYNAIMDEVKDTRGSEGLQGVWASDTNNESEEEEEWLDVSEVAFVDDMLSFLVYDTEEEVEVWATRVIECFETFEMKANVSKLEIMVVAWGKGSKPISREVARGRLKFNVRGITIKATTSVKYLGTKIDVKASSQKEVNAKVQAASQAFTRLSRNIWKSGTLSERSKVKAFRTLVLPLLLFGTECLLLAKQQENKLERWQTKQLWKIVRSRSDYGKRRPASDELRERCQARPSCL